MIERHDPTRASDLLHQLYALWVVFLLDLLVIFKARILLRRAEVLEACRVKAGTVLLATEVLNEDVVWLLDPVMFSFSSDGVRVDVSVWLAAVWWILEVDQGRGHSLGARVDRHLPVYAPRVLLR